MARKMEDDAEGLRGRYPDSPEQSVVTLSPILDDDHGSRYRYGSFSGEVPADHTNLLGISPEGDEDTYPTRSNRRSK